MRCEQIFAPGVLKHELEPRQETQALVDGNHFPGVLDLRLDADGDVATPGGFADRIRRVDLAFEFPFVEVVASAGPAAHALAATPADLLVVGSRGLSGVLALGSVSERVAHEAATSVLVVR